MSNFISNRKNISISIFGDPKKTANPKSETRDPELLVGPKT